MSIQAHVHGLPLIDHHCHGLVIDDVDRAGFESLISESAWPAPPGTSFFDTQLGLAVRRWCAPVLDLDPGASPDEYLRRRRELGAAEVVRRLLGASGIAHYLVDTGYGGREILDPAGMTRVTGLPTDPVVRLETVAEQVVRAGTTAAGYAADLDAALATATVDAVGLKSIIAYRYGLDFDPARPSDGEVAAAAGRWLARYEATAQARLDDPVLLRHLLWIGVDAGKPIQLHVGFGDADLDLHRGNPLHLTRWLRAVRRSGTQVLLLHCYPYHREAGYLAHVFPHVYCDVGLAVTYTGSRSAQVIAESLELTPFHKSLFSTDAFGLAELYHVGAMLFRRGLARTLDAWVGDGDCPVADAQRIAAMICADNARRVYGLSTGAIRGG